MKNEPPCLPIGEETATLFLHDAHLTRMLKRFKGLPLSGLNVTGGSLGVVGTTLTLYLHIVHKLHNVLSDVDVAHGRDDSVHTHSTLLCDHLFEGHVLLHRRQHRLLALLLQRHQQLELHLHLHFVFALERVELFEGANVLLLHLVGRHPKLDIVRRHLGEFLGGRGHLLGLGQAVDGLVQGRTRLAVLAQCAVVLFLGRLETSVESTNFRGHLGQ
mmetsp:Transcript_52856/g.123520  ORF Transcript_52856/g.123520 Transcript_52856/m.123520 type:complete len:216 (+) Transcript_52856:320-967(+)